MPGPAANHRTAELPGSFATGPANLGWPLLTREQVAFICGISITQVKQWEIEGRLTRTKWGDRIVRYPSRDLVHDIMAHTTYSRLARQPVNSFGSPRLDAAQFTELCHRLERAVSVLSALAINRQKQTAHAYEETETIL